MALVTILRDDRKLTASADIANFLNTCGIDYEQWDATRPVDPGSPAEDILQAYANEIEKLKVRGGYATADVIDVKPDTPGLDEMLAKFNREHWHDEDEVRFIIFGSGLFHIHDRTAGVIAIQVEAGDLIRVPKGTRHWFNLCSDRRIRAIRLFQDRAGWTPHYTESKVDQNYLPICFGPTHLPLTQET